jgi:acyl carrier protein
MDELVDEIKLLLIETLDLEDMKPEDIITDAPLFNDGLGLDSIDALEIGVAIQKRYGLKIDTESEDIAKWFHSIKSLSEFVEDGRQS